MSIQFPDRRSPDYMHLPRQNEILDRILKEGDGLLVNRFTRRQFELELLNAICKDDQAFRKHATPIVRKFSEILTEVMPKTLLTVIDFAWTEIDQDVAVEMVGGVLRGDQHGDVSFCCSSVDDDNNITSQVKCFYAFNTKNDPANTDTILQHLTEHYQKGNRYDLKPLTERGKWLYDKHLELIKTIDPEARIFVTQFSKAPVAALVSLSKLSTTFGFVIRSIVAELDPNEIELVSKVPVEPPYKLF